MRVGVGDVRVIDDLAVGVFGGFPWSSPVGLLEALSNPGWEARRLLAMAPTWRSRVHSGQPAVQSTAPPSPRWLKNRLAADAPEAMVEEYLAGETALAVAERYGVSLKTVRRILQAHGARKQA